MAVASASFLCSFAFPPPTFLSPAAVVTRQVKVNVERAIRSLLTSLTAMLSDRQTDKSEQWCR